MVLVIAGIRSLIHSDRRSDHDHRQGVRKIHRAVLAKTSRGPQMYGGQTQYMPFEGELCRRDAITFAGALLLFPATIVQYGFRKQPYSFARICQCGFSTGWPPFIVALRQ